MNRMHTSRGRSGPWKRLRFKARYVWLASYPRVLLPLVKWRVRSRIIDDWFATDTVSKHTDLVIEGYPRSGNTFVAMAFLKSQSHPVRVSHHVHSPGQIIRAGKLGVPVLLLIRSPLDSAVSWSIRDPGIDLAMALRAWISFYRPLLRSTDSFVLATFHQATTDLGRIIGRLNKRFSTDFQNFDHNEDNVLNVFRDIEARNGALQGTGQVVEATVARPSGHRSDRQAQLRHYAESDDNIRRLERVANGIYDELVSCCA